MAPGGSPGGGSARNTPRYRASDGSSAAQQPDSGPGVQQHPAVLGVKRSDSSRSMLDSGGSPERSGGSTSSTSSGSRDNIKVAVRIRPLSDKERSRGDASVWATDGAGGVGLRDRDRGGGGGGGLQVKYAYDLVFGEPTTNEQVFELVGRQVVEPVVTGVSGTVFAYGVTSSGKTHTMMGTAADPGVVPRSIAVLFDQIARAGDRAFTVTFSMMEIYCEMLNDLLDSTKMNLDVQERELPGGRGAVLQVKSLTEGRVASAEEALELIQQGQENRKVGATAYNDQSSRSHTLCRFLVESCPAATAGASAGAAAMHGGGSGGASTRTSAWLTLVDLAGSEGAKAALSKDQQAEARDINRSLLTLGKVVFELAKGSQAGHVPYRDSLLTRLLKPSLTGNGARVSIICNVTPASSQSEETWNTLRFADGAKRIKVTAVKNEALDVAAVVAQYQRELESLKAQLAALSRAAAAGGGSLSPAALQAMHASLCGSSSANAADQLADQEARLRHLQEANSIVALERDQLLAMNRRMVALLVQQLLGGGGGGGGGGAAAAGAAGLRRCLSLESAPLYACWQPAPPPAPQQHCQHQQQQGEAAAEGDDDPLSAVGGLLRLSQEDSPSDSIAGSAAAAMLGSSEAPTPTGQQQRQQGAAAPAGEVYFPGSRRTSKTLALVPPGAPSPCQGAVPAPWLGAAATPPRAAAAALLESWQRRTPLPERAALRQELEQQRERVDLLVQQLADKEALLDEARQMQESQALQLRLTITAADRALLRDKLAEAEQQAASYQEVLRQYESEQEELYDTAYSLYGKLQRLSEQNHAAVSELSALKAQLAAASGSIASGAGDALRRSLPALPAGCGGTSGGNAAFARPKSAIAALGASAARPATASVLAQVAGDAGTAAAAAAAAPDGVLGSPRQLSRIPSSGLIARGASGSGAAASGGAPLRAASLSAPSKISGGGFGGGGCAANGGAPGQLHPICITSPFGGGSDPAAAAAVASSSPEPAAPARSPGGWAATGVSSGGGSCLASGGGVHLPSGASRIPLPPCLQQRPRHLLARDSCDGLLLRFGTLRSKLPAAPPGSSPCVAAGAPAGAHHSRRPSLIGASVLAAAAAAAGTGRGPLQQAPPGGAPAADNAAAVADAAALAAPSPPGAVGLQGLWAMSVPPLAVGHKVLE